MSTFRVEYGDPARWHLRQEMIASCNEVETICFGEGETPSIRLRVWDAKHSDVESVIDSLNESGNKPTWK